MQANIDPTDLSAQADDAEAQAQAEAVTASQRAEDLRWLMGHPAGRRFAWRVLAQSHLHETSFTANASVTAFREGERNVGLWLQGEILDETPDAYLKMLKEHK